MGTAPIVTNLGDVEAVPSAVSIGFFDGVHRGHQTIIRQARHRAERAGLRSVVVTFDRHPMEVVAPGSQPKLLMTHARRARTLAEVGIDLVAVVPFDDDLRHRSPEAFVDQILCGRLEARHVVIGANFRFGHRAAGDMSVLTDLGEARGFTVEGVTLLELDDVIISSTEIRAAIDAGDVERAREMLGRPHSVDGVVVRGAQRGRTLGFPTMNVRVGRRVAVPARGVYAGLATLPGGRAARSVTNVGVNPTFGGQELRVETHLLDHAEDLYGAEVSVGFSHRIRDERRFDGPEDLAAQIGRDAEAARSLLAG